MQSSNFKENLDNFAKISRKMSGVVASMEPAFDNFGSGAYKGILHKLHSQIRTPWNSNND